jgi:hypothetical protein
MSYSRELEQKYVLEYKKLHEDPSFLKKGYRYGYGDGRATHSKFDIISKIVKKYDAKSILDFGCGKAMHHNKEKIYDSMGIFEVGLYDPAIKEYETLYDRKYDGVVCVDVMEHIPEENVDFTISTALSRANLFAFFAISCNPARDRLSDGSNAHITIRTPEWWIDKYQNKEVDVYLEFSYNKKSVFVDVSAGVTEYV